MKLLEKILVATNFGKDSDQTIQAAVSVAKTFNSEIILLHVIPKVSGFPTAVENLKKKVTENSGYRQCNKRRFIGYGVGGSKRTCPDFNV